MKRLALGVVIGGIVGAVLILIILFLFDGNNKNGREGLRLVTTDTSKVNEVAQKQLLVYGDYMSLDSTNYLLIPLGMHSYEEQENRLLKNKSIDDYSSAESYNRGYVGYKYNFYALSFANCNNIIFYNKKTDSTHLLLQKPALLSEFYFPYYTKEYVGKKYWFLLLGIHEHDTNADGYINGDDAEIVYITDLSGKNKIQITPDNTQLIDWYIDESTNNILLKVRADSDNDLKFTATDEIEILKTSISKPEKAYPIIGQNIKNDIKKILEQIK
ncbi:MAG: hypothetical protein WBM13_12075 [Bacteroidia bacterium]